MQIDALNGNFGRAVSEIDIPTLDDEKLLEILTSLYANRFVVIKSGGLNKAEYRNFARRIGDPIPLSCDADFPEIAHISNLETSTAKSRLGAAHWHTDQSFKQTVSSTPCSIRFKRQWLAERPNFVIWRQLTTLYLKRQKLKSTNWSSNIDTEFLFLRRKATTDRYLLPAGIRTTPHFIPLSVSTQRPEKKRSTRSQALHKGFGEWGRRKQRGC